MQKRGQAAMEFLMTYGWAILAVIISIAALAYFGVLSPSLFLPESCTLFPGLACTDTVIGKNAVVITVRNGIGNSISNLKIGLPGLPCISKSFSLAEGESRNIGITGASCNIAGSLKNDINISYTIQVVSHTRFGRIAGKAGPGNLVAHYKFDEGAGIATDNSGFGNNGIFPGGTANPTYLSTGCVSGGCFSFDGNDYIEITDPFLNNKDFSISMYAYTSVLNDGFYHALIGKQPGVELCRKPSMYLSPGGNGLTYDIYNSACGDRRSNSVSSIFLATFTWYNVIWVKKGTNSYFYREGNLISTVTAPASGDFYNLPTSAYWIGRIDNYWNGRIDEVMIYDYAIR